MLLLPDWKFTMLLLPDCEFNNPATALSGLKNPVSFVKAYNGGDPSSEELSSSGFKLYEIVLPVFHFLSTKRFASAGFLTMDICSELLQVFSYSMCMDNSWDTLSVSVLSQIVKNCPETFYEAENFAYLAMELCLAYLNKVFQSTEAMSLDKSLENLISSILVTAETLVNCFQPKKHLVSAALAFLLIGYKGIREVTTDFCFSKLDEYFKCTNLLLKRFIDDICSVGDDGTLQMRKILGTCLNVVTNLTKDCIKCIQMLENKRSDLHTLLQTKLAFSLEQTISFAKLAYEMDYLEANTDGDSMYYGMFKYCTRCVQAALADSSLQVQEIGLQVLRNLIQKGTAAEDDTFLLLFVGELATDFFLIMQNMLKKPVTEKAASVAGECLRLLVLLQTSSKSNECQRGFMNLLLEAVLMVFKASEEGSSQEMNKLRSTAVRLVSHLAQVPSSAVHFKDVLLSMPLTHRQQFQGFIRASVTQEHNATQMKPTTPFLEIKLPVPTVVSKEKQPPLPAARSHSPVTDHQRDEEGEEEEEDDDEDDWDAFQSFPATTNAAENDSRVDSALETPDLVEKSSLSEKTGSDQFHGLLNNVEATSKADHQEAGEAEVISDSPDDLTSSQGNILGHNVETEEPHDSQPRSGVIEVCDDLKERDDKLLYGPEEGKGAGFNEVIEHRTSELHPIEDARGLAGWEAHHEQGRENTDDRPVQSSSDHVNLDEEVNGAASNQVTEHIPSELHPVEDPQGLIAVNSTHHEQDKESPENRPVQVSSDPVKLDEEVKDKREDKEEPETEEPKLQQHTESSEVQDLGKSKDDTEKSE